MSMNEENNANWPGGKFMEQATAFQKMWAETYGKLMQTAFTVSPDAAPPDLLRQIRSGIFRALSESWEQFLGSPQFLETMKQWMDNSINMRQMSNEWLTTMRHEMQAPAREDVDTIMLTVRHLETRLLDRLEDVATQLEKVSQRLDRLETKSAPPQNHQVANSPAPAMKVRRRTRPTAKKNNNLIAP